MRRLVVLRPEPGASETVARAGELGLDAMAVPLFAIAPLPWTVPDPAGFDALLLTSANAVRHGGDGLMKVRALPVHAVGDATARAARDAGFDIRSTGDAGVDRLLGSIEPDQRLLHLSGEPAKASDIASQHVTRIAVYRASAIEQPELPQVANAVVLIHSPRAGARLAALVSDRSTIAIAAISAAAAEAVGHGWQSVDIADEPRDDALLALAARLCNSSAP